MCACDCVECVRAHVQGSDVEAYVAAGVPAGCVFLLDKSSKVTNQVCSSNSSNTTVPVAVVVTSQVHSSSSSSTEPVLVLVVVANQVSSRSSSRDRQCRIPDTRW